MLKLKEFITRIAPFEQYRIYQPNRDCLIFESYYKIHSPFLFDKQNEDGNWYQHNYYDDNDYSDRVYNTKELDDETKIFLQKFGDYKVFRLECSSFCPSRIYKDEKGKVHFERVPNDKRPDDDSLPCFNIFII